jgi:hypothetical protein
MSVKIFVIHIEVVSTCVNKDIWNTPFVHYGWYKMSLSLLDVKCMNRIRERWPEMQGQLPRTIQCWNVP